MKDVITVDVTATTQQKDNKHALTLTELRTANEREMQKTPQELTTLSKRVDRISIREGNKGDGENNGGRGDGGGNHNTSGKNDNKEKNTNGSNVKWICTKGTEYDPTWPYKKMQWFNKERNLADKKLRREYPAHLKKNKRARLEKD